MRSYSVVVKEEKDEQRRLVGGGRERKIFYLNRTDLGIRIEAEVPSTAMKVAKQALLALPGMRKLNVRSVSVGPNNTINIVVSLHKTKVKQVRGWTWRQPPSTPE